MPTPAAKKATEPMSLADAIVAAAAKFPRARPIVVEREEIQGVKLIEVELLDADRVHEIYLDPTTRAVTREGLEPLDETARARLPTLDRALAGESRDLVQAVTFAEERHMPGAIQRVAFDVDDDAVVLAVVVAEVGGAVRYLYAPRSGEVLDREPWSPPG